MATIGDVFPANAPVARFLVSMAMASNDIEHAVWKAGDTNEADRPEMFYWVRLVMGHFVEAADALQRWRSESPEVRAFVAALPIDAREALSGVEKALTNVGRAAVAHARNHTFHYPAPSGRYASDAALADVLSGLAAEPVSTGEVEGHPGRVRYVFADQAALMVAMGKHRLDDEVAYRAQVADLQRGATHFVNFALRALEAHLFTE